MKKARRIYLIYLIIFPAILLAASYFVRYHDTSLYTKTSFMMGTIVEISVAGGERGVAERALEAAFKEISRIEDKFSAFKETSVVGRINRLEKGASLIIDDEAAYLISEAIRYNKLTDGAFDITIKPLLDLWGFSRLKERVPSEAEIKDALQYVGTDHIILDMADKRIGFDKPGIRIDLSGIAKGYATDRAIKALEENGIKNAIVNSGGDAYCLGRRSPARPWSVGVQNPRLKNQLIGRLDVSGRAVVTSGDYEKFFKAGDKRLCHIIDPKTGMPCGDRPSSVTIIASSATEADALATAFMVLGPGKAAPIMSKNFNVDWIAVSERPDGNLEIVKSKDLEERYAYREK